MRDLFLPILALLAITDPASAIDAGKDVNYYKDYLRARNDEGIPEPGPGDRMLYFYRTPLQLYPGLIPALEQEYRKRTGNAFKNHMLSKEVWAEVEKPRKRTSKTALSLMLTGKNYPHTERWSTVDSQLLDM